MDRAVEQTLLAGSSRIARARALEPAHPSSAGVLAFYAELTGFQQTLLREAFSVIRKPSAAGASVAAAIDAAAASALVPGLLDWLGTIERGRLAGAARALAHTPPHDWQRRIGTYCSSNGDDLDDGAGEIERFAIEALLQPFAEVLALQRRSAGDAAGAPVIGPTAAAGPRCPLCTRRPVVATLRERGQGAPRALVCGLCLTEWPSPRIVCPACGETGFDALPVYRAEEFAGVRVDACDRCHTYIKTIDLTVHGAAIPIVDDLASLPLDLWAAEQGYRKIRPNLLRL